jgi:sec-independent protein translocase protein TatA
MDPLIFLAFFGPIGTTELVVVLLILILIFGASKLPQLGGALGKTLKSFKSEMKDGLEEGEEAAPAKERFCSKCGAPNDDPDAEFCSKCGQAV